MVGRRDKYNTDIVSLATNLCYCVRYPQNLPEKNDLWRNILAAGEIARIVDPLGIQSMLVSIFVRDCISTTEDKYWLVLLQGIFWQLLHIICVIHLSLPRNKQRWHFCCNFQWKEILEGN